MRLVQIRRGPDRRVAIVEEPRLRLLDGCTSVYELASVAIASEKKLCEVAQQCASDGLLDYEQIYLGRSEWQLLSPIDHVLDSARCLISGTGLTHLGSARGRQSMHATPDELVTDSMRMFRWGVEGGRPESGSIGTSPEWFYKGNGTTLRAHGEALLLPPFALDGGEEAELAGIYIVSPEGNPYRGHRRPGDLHIHFFGTDCLSFSDGVSLEEGDIMEIGFEGFGRPLRNPLHLDRSSPELVRVRSL